MSDHTCGATVLKDHMVIVSLGDRRYGVVHIFYCPSCGWYDHDAVERAAWLDKDKETREKIRPTLTSDEIARIKSNVGSIHRRLAAVMTGGAL